MAIVGTNNGDSFRTVEHCRLLKVVDNAPVLINCEEMTESL